MTVKDPPLWPCPACKRGRLVLDRKTLRTVETPGSIATTGSSDGLPDDYEGRFICLVVCSSCQEPPIPVAGRVMEEIVSSDQYGFETRKLMIPEFFYSSPPIFKVPDGCKPPVRKAIYRSFKLFWCDVDACGNAIRTSIELLLTSLKVKRKPHRAARGWLTLDDRIKLYRKKKPKLGDAMLAVKWLGNAGSHPGRLTRTDIFDAYDMLEHVLLELYEQRSKRLDCMVKRTNRQRGPGPRKRPDRSKKAAVK